MLNQNDEKEKNSVEGQEQGKEAISAENVEYTIKSMGLKKIVTQPRFSSPDFQINTLLTSDLTSEEIVESLKVIVEMKDPLMEFIKKYEDLSEKLESNEKKYDVKKKDAENMGEWDWAIFYAGIPALIIVTLLYKGKVIPNFIMAVIIGLLSAVGLVWGYLTIKSDSQKRSNELLKECEDISSVINALKQEIKNLSGVKLLKNAFFGVSTLSALFISKRLLNLSDILQKMLIIAEDKENTASARLLAMENFLYLVRKQAMDEKLMDETKRANDLAEEKIKEMQKVRDAVNLQTEYQVWQDLGAEANKASVAHRLFKDN